MYMHAYIQKCTEYFQFELLFPHTDYIQVRKNAELNNDQSLNTDFGVLFRYQDCSNLKD